MSLYETKRFQKRIFDLYILLCPKPINLILQSHKELSSSFISSEVLLFLPSTQSKSQHELPPTIPFHLIEKAACIPLPQETVHIFGITKETFAIITANSILPQPSYGGLTDGNRLGCIKADCSPGGLVQYDDSFFAPYPERLTSPRMPKHKFAGAMDSYSNFTGKDC